jgi:hypothetical protein
MSPREERLINRFVESGLEGEELAAFQELLLRDAEARQCYYDLTVVDHLLGERRGSFAAAPTLREGWAGGRERRARLLAASGWAAALVAGLWAVFFALPRDKQAADVRLPGPEIHGSADSRIVIAQRQEGGGWRPGEWMRIERGSASLRLSPHVSAHIQGPAAVELLDPSGNLRMLEGKARFVVGSGGEGFEVHAPGGLIRDLGTAFSVEVFADGTTDVQVDQGAIEVLPEGKNRGSATLQAGQALRLGLDGESQAIRHDVARFRLGLPQAETLFEDDFETSADTPLAAHRPQVGGSWEILEEYNPTLLRQGRLDTSSGPRLLRAGLQSHAAPDARAVYVFTFEMLPPEWIHDKERLQDGFESITLLGEGGQGVIHVQAAAADGHRWCLRDESDVPASPLTNISALWKHTLTLCYGMDGRVTLHDGASAQAPIIAECMVAVPQALGGILLTNRFGGDLAIDRMTARLLRGPGGAGGD